MKQKALKKNIPAKQQAEELLPKAASKKSFFNGQNKVPYLVIFITSFVLYANTLFMDYALDDRLMITENTFTKKGFAGIPDILTSDSFVGFFGKQKNLVAGGRYRPLSHISFAIEYQLFGFKPFIGHLINVLLYGFACLLIFKVLLLLFHNRKKNKWYLTIPFIATILFAAHPLHTEVVANIKGRDEIMSLIGSFAALYFILKYVQNVKPIQLLWASISFFLALLSKENAITFVVLIPITLFFFTNVSLKRGFIATLPLVFCAFLFVIIRYKVLGFLLGTTIETELLNNPFLYCSTPEKFATIFLTWGKYLLLILFPHPLTHDYYPKQIPIIQLADFRAIIPLLLYVLMTIYAILRFHKKDIFAYGILLFGITFSISSNLLFPIGTFMNERFMFIPILGFTIALAYFLVEKLPKLIKNTKNFQQGVIVFLTVLTLGYSVKTIARNPAWTDDYTLFTTDVKVSKNSAKCNVSAGGQTLEKAEKELDQVKKKKMIADAIVFLQKGIELHPKYTAGWLLLGKAMIDMEDYAKSREYYETALKIIPGQKEALNNWLYCAQMSSKNSDYKEAITSYSKLITYSPKNLDLQLQLAGVYEKMKAYDTVIVIMEGLIKTDSTYAAAYAKLGEIYGKIFNKIDISLEYLLKAYTVSPTDASNLENIGIAYGMKGENQKSIDFFTKALAVNPDNEKVYLNMSGTYKNMGNISKAEECVKKAIEIQQKTKTAAP